MSTRGDYQSATWSSGSEAGSAGRSAGQAAGDIGSQTVNAVGTMTANAMDLMVRMPLQMTAAGLQWMTSGMQRLGQGAQQGSSRYTSSWQGGPQGYQVSGGRTSYGNSGSQSSSLARGLQGLVSTAQSIVGGDTDLSGPDLKYVTYSIVFTKPGYEAILQPQQNELVNYSTDTASFAALKIAKCLESARHGRTPKPTAWVEHGYPGESHAASSRRSESASSMVGKSESSGQEKDKEKGWRIPAEDQKYIQCLFRVEWRLPKQEVDVTHERITIERDTNTTSTVS